MASFDGETYADQTGTPVVPINSSDVRVFYAAYTFVGTEASATSDTLNLLNIPAGYAIIGGQIRFDDLMDGGSGMLLDVGISGDVDCFADGISVETASFSPLCVSIGANDGGLDPQTAETTVIATVIGTTVTGLADATFEIWLLGVRDVGSQ